MKKHYLDEDQKKSYSILGKLREQGKSNVQFESMVNLLTLEELIGIKLEISLSSVSCGLYGLSLWSSVLFAAKEALYNFAKCFSLNKTEMIRMLGIYPDTFYEFEKLFEEKVDE